MELPLTDKLIDRQRDALYKYNAVAHKEITDRRPWAQNPYYFKTVRISSAALTKMVMHARSGGSIEVMGLMQGYIDGTAFVVTDAFRLPVEGTETRVNAQGEADEYMVQYLGAGRDESRPENVVGWYHSHPGYGCWLSGIDVATQQLQQLSGAMVAVVIDPDRTVSANKVEIGAFRTFPEGYSPSTSTSTTSTSSSSAGLPSNLNSTTSVPMNKASDFGAHANKYYALEVEHFKSTLDTKLLEMLWNKYWVQTLAQNPLLSNRDYSNSQMVDVGHRVCEAATVVARAGGGGSGRDGGAQGIPGFGDVLAGIGGGVGGGGGGGSGGGTGPGGRAAASDQAVGKVVQDIGQIAAKERAGLMAAEVKAKIFSSDGTSA